MTQSKYDAPVNIGWKYIGHKTLQPRLLKPGQGNHEWILQLILKKSGVEKFMFL